MAIATAQAVQLLNLAYFGRPGDPASLPAWGAAGITESKIAEIFVSTTEFTASTSGVTASGGVRTYSSTTYINTLYNRLVGRDAAASEVTAWSDAVSAGHVTFDNLGHVLVNAILNLDESVEMRKVMMAKLDTANLYSDYLEANPTDLSAYSTQAGIDAGRAFMDTVTTSTAKTYSEVAATADLLDDPSKFTITSAAATASEGQNVTFTVTLDSAPTSDVTVNYLTSNGTADSADFTAASGTVTFAAGQTTQYVTVKTTEDTSVEVDETFNITFSGPRLTSSVQAVGTISNDDAAPTKYDITSAAVTASEGNDFVFTVTLDSAPTEAVTVNYITGNGSTDSSDFTAASGSITFAAGQTSQIVTVNTSDDTSFEEDETFTITFSGESLNASVQAIGTITNDDANPTLAAQVLTLTTGINTLTGLDGDDTFDASTSNSLNNFDTLVGGGGTDTLTSVLAGTSVVVNSTGIEQFNITATTASTLDMAGVTGLTGLNNLNSAVDLTVNKLGVLPTVDLTTNSAETILNFASDAISGTADDLQINLLGAAASTVTLTRAAGNTESLETVSLNSGTVANTLAALTTTGADVSTVEITGDQNLSITAPVSGEVTTVSASAFTGDLSITLNANGVAATSGSGADTIVGGAGADSFTTGAGADSITAGDGNDTVTAGAGADVIILGADAGNDSVDAGSGADTIQMSGAADALTEDDTIGGGADADTIQFTAAATVVDADFTNVTAVETLTASDDTAFTSLIIDELAAAAGVTTVTFTDDDTADAIDVEAGFTNTLTINMAGDTAAHDIDASAYTGTLTVTALDTSLNNTASIITGGTGSDTLQVTTTGTVGADITNATLAQVSKIETIEFVGDNAATLTLNNANTLVVDGVAETMTIDATALLTSVATISAENEADALVVINTGGGDDIVTASVSSGGGDSISTGDGDDTIIASSAQLTSADTISGGAGTDIIQLSNDAAAADDIFEGLNSIETLASSADIQLEATLGEFALAAGINTVTFNDLNAIDTLTVGADFTRDLTVNLDADTFANVVTATNYTGNLLVNVNNDAIDATASGEIITLTGGTGTDTLRVTADTGNDSVVTGDVVSITNFETIEFVESDSSADATTSFVSNDANIADGASLTIDATALSGAAVINIAAETNGSATVNTGSGDDTVTASQSDQGDSISTGAGDDTVVASSAQLTIAGGGTNDTIAGGTGDDTIQISNDAAAVDGIFAGLSSFEIVASSDGVQLEVDLGANAAAAGITTVNFNDLNDHDTLTVGAGFTNNLTVNLDADTDANSVVATNYTGVLTVTADDVDIDSTSGGGELITITGGTGSDVLQITVDTDNDAIAAADLANITKIETFQILEGVDDATANITLSNNNAAYTHAALFDTLTVDATDLSTAAATIDATAEVNAKIIINTGGGGDTISASRSANFGDSINSGAGDDTIQFVNDGDLTNIDSVNGGAGTDTVSFSAASTVADVHFANIENIETVTAAANTAFTDLTLGTNALAAGVSTLTLQAANSVVTVDSGFTGPLDIAVSTGNDTIDASGSSGAMSFSAAVGSITADDAIAGGSGSTDSLTLTADSGRAILTGVSGIETITITDVTDATARISMGDVDTQIAEGATLTVDASGMDQASTTFRFDGSASETDGFLNITGGTGADTIVGAGSNDTISAGLAVDSITGGNGADSITGGAGNDIFVYTAAAQSNSTNTDTITDFTTTEDILQVTLDYSALAQSQTVNATLVTAAAGITAVQNSLSAERGQYIYDTTNSKLYVNVNNDNLISTLDYQISMPDATIADGDLDFAISASTAGDSITSGGGADTITGGAGADSVTAGGGADSVTGAAGDDTLTGGLGDDTLSGGDGADSVTAGAGADSVTGGAGDDTLSGGDGADTVTAGAGADSVTGGAGNDTLNGGTGNDTLTGAAGSDTYIQNADSLSTVASAISGIDADISDGAAVWTFANGVDIVTDFTGGADEILASTATVAATNKVVGAVVNATAVVAGNYYVIGTWDGDAATFTYASDGDDMMYGFASDDDLSTIANNGTRSMILVDGASNFVVGDIVAA